MTTLRHITKTAAMLALAATGAWTATLITATPARAITPMDLQADGFATQSDNQGNGCIQWSAAVPNTAWTPVGDSCDTNINDEVANWYVAHIAALRQYQAASKTQKATTVTVTVPTTIYDAGATTTITQPATTETITGPTTTIHDTTTDETTITTPPITQWATTTIYQEQPPATETVTTTETVPQIVIATQTVTVQGKAQHKATRRVKRLTKAEARRTG